MKRAATTHDDKGKKARRSLAFLGTCVSTARLLSDGATWKAAKAAAASQDVRVACIKEDSSTSTLCIQGSVTAPPKGSKVAAAAHTHPFPGQAQVQLLLDIRSGELLDADTSCCPGGYHAARGSLCPCVGALLLAAAQLQSLEHGEHQELALPHWVGTDIVAVQDHTTHKAGSLQQLVQPGLLQRAPAELPQPLAEVEVLPATHTQAKINRDPHSYHGCCYPKANPQTIGLLFPNKYERSPQPALLLDEPCDLPVEDEHMPSGDQEVAPAAAGRPAAAAAENAEGDQAGSRPLDLLQILALLGGVHLTTYMGTLVPGWQERPKVVNWAFRELMAAAADTQPYRGPGPCSSTAATVGRIQDAKPLVALTGLLRVLWSCIHVEGLPVELRGVLLVAMALRNLLLVVALPLWARKAVAAQLRAWQEGIGEAHACNPVQQSGMAKLVHLLRVLKEAEQLCQHGWDHLSLSIALQCMSSSPENPAAAGQEFHQHHLAASSQLSLMEEPGLVLLRMNYLGVLLGQAAAYLNLALSGKQWSHAVSFLMRSGDRSQLRLAAQLLEHHITSLPERLDYMIQLLETEELGVVERCELAGRLMLSLRGDLVPYTQQPHVRTSQGDRHRAFWEVQMWALPNGSKCSVAPTILPAQLTVFLKKFFTLVGQAQFDLAKESVTEHSEGPANGATAAATAGPAEQSTAAPAASSPLAVVPPHILAVNSEDALAALEGLPLQLWWCVVSFLQAGTADIKELGADVCSQLSKEWGMRWQVIWLSLVACHTWPGGVPKEHGPGGGLQSPSSLLELDQAMLHHGQPSQRVPNQVPAWIYMDSMGFVDGSAWNDQGPIDNDKVEPFPLPNLLPLCGLAPAALHAAVQGAVAPLFDAAFRPSNINGTTTLAASRPGDLGARLLQVAGHPGVEYGGSAVRLQMAVDMVAYTAALTPLGDASAAFTTPGGDALQLVVYRHLLYNLLAIGQQDLAWTVAKAAYRTYPGRFTATYLLLLAIERGYEAQAAAVDWIVGKDWPQAADTAAQQEETDEDILMGLDSSSPVNAPAFAGSENGSSMDTQQLLGGDAADALQLADTASSWVQQMQRHQARQAHAHAAQHRVQNATTGGTAATVGSMVAQQVRWTLGSFVEACQDHVEATFWRSALLALVNATGLHASGLTRVLEDLRGDVRDHYGGNRYDDDSDGELEDFDNYFQAAVWTIINMAEDAGPGDSAAPRLRQPPGTKAFRVSMNAALNMSLSDLAYYQREAADRGVPGEDGVDGWAGPAVPPASAATTRLERELLGVTGRAWRDRASLLQLLELQPVIQYTAACGLHPDLVTRLALWELGAEPMGAATPPVTWATWMDRGCKRHGIEARRAGALPTPPQGETPASAFVLAAPGMSIEAAACEYDSNTVESVSAGFAQWVVHWLECQPSGVAPLLRQLWPLLQGHCYSPWMLWFAAALHRAGEQELACQAAAQGMLPHCCHFWDMISVKQAYAACFEALLPTLARCGDPAILQQAAATQLLMAQAPVPGEMLLGKGVLEHLLDVTTQLVPCCMSPESDKCLQAPASCIDMDTGELVADVYDKRGCNLLVRLLHKRVVTPLGEHVSQGLDPTELRTASSPEEELVLAALEPAVAKLHWSMGLYMVRAAREAGVIRSWPGLVRLLWAPLAAAVDEFQLLSQNVYPSCNTLNDWVSQRGLYEPLITVDMEEAGTWINGVLAWVVQELGAADGAPATQPPLECVEELYTGLLGFYSPHVVLYAAAALQAVKGQGTAGNTSSLIRYGVLPLVGRPENLQAGSAKSVRGSDWVSKPWPSSFYRGWGQASYTQALGRLLQQGQLLASLPAGTIRNMALTYWVSSGTVEAMVWVGQLLDWLPQRHVVGLLPTAAGGRGDGQGGAGAGMEEGPAQLELPELVSPEELISLQVPLDLVPFLDLAQAAESVSDRARLRFVHLQIAANRYDEMGALGVLFNEAPSALEPDATCLAPECSELEEQMLELEAMFELLAQPAYAGTPAVRWLAEQPRLQHMQQLLQGFQTPGMPSTSLAALDSPWLQLRVLQYKLWRLCKTISYGPPDIMERIDMGPPKPWEQQLTELQTASFGPSYSSVSAGWEQLPYATLEAACAAARTAIPGEMPVSRWGMVSTVLRWLQAQELTLAWTVVKYAELRGSVGALMLDEVRALVSDPHLLSQLPVFMSQLGAAVKQQWTYYPLYALFRPVRLPQDLYNFMWDVAGGMNENELHEHLYTHNRLALQQLMVQTVPWLDWQQASKEAEVHALAEWLWWLAVDAQKQEVPGVNVTTHTPYGANGPSPVTSRSTSRSSSRSFSSRSVSRSVSYSASDMSSDPEYSEDEDWW